MRVVSLIGAAVALAACPAPSTPVEAPEAPAAPAPAEVAPPAAPAEAAPAEASAIPVRKDDAERKSKNGHLQATIDGVEVDVRYGRPEARERELWGSLIPYGQVWRTGADEATTLSLSADATIAGTPVPAGVYALFTVPGEAEWTVIVNKVPEQWGAFKHDASQDEARVTVPVAEAEHAEAFTIEEAPDGIALRWGTVSVIVPIAAG